MKEWFFDWFETPYYKALYRERDETEADRFMKRLTDELQIPTGARILDMACGRGRHALALNQLGYEVTGVDLSFSKIYENQKYENDRLRFYRHDMRHMFRINYFDCVFNFFTSFGYFDSIYDEKKAAYAMAANLKWGGILVLDYLNTALLRNTLSEQESLQADGYTFHITRAIRRNKICKEIRVIESGQCSVYHERVRLYSRQDLCDLFSVHDLDLQQVYGNYQLEAFLPDSSDRMIMVFRKKQNPDA